MNGGDIAPVLIWHAPLAIGECDIVIDANQNGVYDTPAADVSGDSRITSLDALMILQAAADGIEI